MDEDFRLIYGISSTWQFFVPLLGWLSDLLERLSDVQLGDKKVTLNHLAGDSSNVTWIFSPIVGHHGDSPLTWVTYSLTIPKKVAQQNHHGSEIPIENRRSTRFSWVLSG